MEEVTTLLSNFLITLMTVLLKSVLTLVFLFPAGFFILSEFLSLRVFGQFVLPPGKFGNFGLNIRYYI